MSDGCRSTGDDHREGEENVGQILLPTSPATTTMMEHQEQEKVNPSSLEQTSSNRQIEGYRSSKRAFLLFSCIGARTGGCRPSIATMLAFVTLFMVLGTTLNAFYITSTISLPLLSKNHREEELSASSSGALLLLKRRWEEQMVAATKDNKYIKRRSYPIANQHIAGGEAAKATAAPAEQEQSGGGPPTKASTTTSSLPKQHSSQQHQDCPTPSTLRSMPLTRALAVYLPMDDEENHYMAEFRWFFRSWIEMMKSEPAAWRTDIILYVDKSEADSEHLKAMGCAPKRRTSQTEPPLCIIVDTFTSIEARKTQSTFQTDFERRIAKELGDYPYTNSILSLAEGGDAFADYDWVLRTDLDTFLTPAFSFWTPPNCSFVAGNGAFSTDYNQAKLGRVAALNHAYFNPAVRNLGSTWVGRGRDVAQVAKRAIHWMVYLSENEFSPTEKSISFWRDNARLWPDWHYGVLSMYGAHMALHEVLQPRNEDNNNRTNSNMIVSTTLLDYPTSSQGACDSTSGHVHLHAWQTNDFFSKYLFQEGAYDKTYIRNQKEYLNNATKTSCQDYSMRMAGLSVTTPPETLADMVLTIKKAGRAAEA